MSARVICISRALCAGADEVAALVAEIMGYRCVDEEIIGRAAERQKLAPAEVASAEQRKSFLARLFEDMAMGAGMASYGAGYVPDPGQMPVRSEQLRGLIRDAILETAERGEVVIVAHAASYALSQRNDVLRVLVTGSAVARAGALAASDGIGPEEAAKKIRESDEARADYLRRFYQVDHELAEHYDLCISTDGLTPAQAAAVIISVARAIRNG